MFDITPDSFFFSAFLCIAFLAAASLVFFLRGLTLEWVQIKGEDETENMWRYGIPALVALTFNYWMNYYGRSNTWNWLYLIITCILLPLIITFVLLTKAIQPKMERLVFLTFRLFFLSSSFVTTEWFWHNRNEQEAYNNEDGYHHETTIQETRDGYLIPLWATTIVFLFASVGLWALREDDDMDREKLQQQRQRYGPQYIAPPSPHGQYMQGQPHSPHSPPYMHEGSPVPPQYMAQQLQQQQYHQALQHSPPHYPPSSQQASLTEDEVYYVAP